MAKSRVMKEEKNSEGQIINKKLNNQGCMNVRGRKEGRKVREKTGYR